MKEVYLVLHREYGLVMVIEGDARKLPGEVLGGDKWPDFVFNSCEVRRLYDEYFNGKLGELKSVGKISEKEVVLRYRVFVG